MAERETELSNSSIVVTVDSSHVSDSTIDYAVAVAAHLKRPLRGVFIEDTDLISTAQLPFTMEICRTTGEPRRFNSETLLSSLGSTALRFRQRLAHQADLQAVSWSVSSMRGRRRDLEFSLSTSDYCIYEAVTPPRRKEGKARQSWRVLVIDGTDQTFFETLVALLSPFAGWELHVTMINTGDACPDERGSVEWPGNTHLHQREVTELPAILQQAGETFDYVVVSRQHWLPELTHLMSQLSCPLVLVG